MTSTGWHQLAIGIGDGAQQTAYEQDVQALDDDAPAGLPVELLELRRAYLAAATLRNAAHQRYFDALTAWYNQGNLSAAALAESWRAAQIKHLRKAIAKREEDGLSTVVHRRELAGLLSSSTGESEVIHADEPAQVSG